MAHALDHPEIHARFRHAAGSQPARQHMSAKGRLKRSQPLYCQILALLRTFMGAADHRLDQISVTPQGLRGAKQYATNVGLILSLQQRQQLMADPVSQN